MTERIQDFPCKVFIILHLLIAFPIFCLPPPRDLGIRRGRHNAPDAGDGQENSCYERGTKVPYYFDLENALSFRKSSASFIRRHKGTFMACAMLSATLTVGFRSNRSMSETILDAKSARSANSSWLRNLAFRCFLIISPKNLAKFFDNIPPLCQWRNSHLQER